MVIADLAKSGRSVFSWAVIADLSFESLRFARWVFSHLSPLCSRLWSGQSHQATFICSSHLFTKNTKKAIIFFVDKILTTSSVWIRCHVSLINDYWFHIAEGTTTCPCDEFGREDITNHCRILRVIAVELLKLLFSCFRWLLIQYKERRPHVCLTNTNVGSGHYRTLPDIGSNGGNDR